jgi:putative Holliday junction resolvase
LRILAVDPGEKRLGLALSDPSGSVANPLKVILHISRPLDAAQITQIAEEQGAGLILVGQALDSDGQPTPASRRSARLAAAIRTQTDLPVILWDESHSTQAAQQARQAMGVSRRQRAGHLDELAATYILQTYLDSQAHADANPPAAADTP